MLQPVEPVFFQFEADFVESLRCIPMVVRYKLDTCGIKLKLDQWSHFPQAAQQQLVSLPCGSPEEVAAYRQYLIDLIWQHAQVQASELAIEDCPPWLDATQIPETVREKAVATAATLTLEQWQALTPLQRFALIKLSRSGHENRNFIPALQEFLA